MTRSLPSIISLRPKKDLAVFIICTTFCVPHYIRCIFVRSLSEPSDAVSLSEESGELAVGIGIGLIGPGKLLGIHRHFLFWGHCVQRFGI